MRIDQNYIQMCNPQCIVEPEQWRHLPGYEGYIEVSNYGNIRSLPHYISYYRLGTPVHRFCELHMYAVYTNIDGYLKVHLSNNRDIFCHRAVALAFLPLPDDYVALEVDHIDYNPQNPYYKNLQWVTPTENRERSYSHVVERNGKMIRDIKSGRIYPSIEHFCKDNEYAPVNVDHGFYTFNGYVPKYDACIEYYTGAQSDIGKIIKFPDDDAKIFELRAAQIRRCSHKGVRCITFGTVYPGAMHAASALGIPQGSVNEALIKYNGIYKKKQLKFEYIDWATASDSDIAEVMPHFIQMYSVRTSGRRVTC